MQYALLSIAQIFKNVCPLFNIFPSNIIFNRYKINEEELAERIKQKIMKEEKKQILYE
jgi:hypothetical protein